VRNDRRRTVDDWSAYASGVPWNVRVEDATADGEILASANLVVNGDPAPAHVHLYYQDAGADGYRLADSWTDSAFVRWTGQGALLEVGRVRGAHQLVTRRPPSGARSTLAQIDVGGFHAYAPADDWLGWLIPVPGDPYSDARSRPRRTADLRRGIVGWRIGALNLNDGEPFVLTSPSAEAEVVAGPVAIAGGRMAITISRPDGRSRRQSGLLLIDLHSGREQEVWNGAFDLHTPVLDGDGMYCGYGASTRSHDAHTPLTHQVHTRRWDATDPAGTCVHDGRSAWATPLSWAGSSLFGLETRCGIRRVVGLGGRSLDAAAADEEADTSVSSAVVLGDMMVRVTSSPVQPDRIVVGKLARPETVADEVPGPPVEHRSERRVFAVEHADHRHTVATRVVRPASSEPTGVVVLFHGGPTMSWSNWSWRWNPLPFVARGYAVVMVDPAGSEGFGMPSLRRAWRRWRDGIAASAAESLRAALGRESWDGLPLALMGGSFGGYLAVQLASRIRAEIVVGHAVPFRPSCVSLTSDAHWSWVREWVDGGGDGVPRPDVDDIDLDGLPVDTTRYVLSHGMTDDIVPHQETVRAARVLRFRGARCETALLPTSGHALTTAAEIQPWLRWAFNHTEGAFADDRSARRSHLPAGDGPRHRPLRGPVQ
jgi:dipeptidyl aminopeptidase/acylaminoacyl peptidase